MTDTARPAATAAQRIVTAMWTLDHPATAKQIQEAAGVGYSTVSPVLRRLLADSQAVKSEGEDGSTLWRLVADTATLTIASGVTTSTAPESQEPPSEDRDGDGAAAGTTSPDGVDHAANAAHSTDGDTAPTGADAATDDQRREEFPLHEDAAPPDGASQAGTSPEPFPAAPTIADAEPEPESAGSDGGTPDADTAAARTTRAYRKPVKPRRPKGALRAAIHAAMAAEPDRAFTVNEMCKVIDGADPDGSFNKAGPGAVVNAFDKLVNDGHATRVAEAPASYRFREKPADADSQS